jgi:ribonuclease BN (tRNA processing enzyme)
MKNPSRRAGGRTEFVVWGCRGSRSLAPGRSRIGNNTSCYSMRHGEDLVVFDAGRGMAVLGWELARRPALRSVRRVHVFVTHAHLDHFEGLKDAEWFWRKGSALELRVVGTAQAVKAVQTAFSHPLYVDLELLATGTASSVRFETLEPGDDAALDGWRIRTRPLFHYSGDESSRDWLDTLGFRVTAPDGATVAYLCDHEPHAGTRAVERELLEASHLAVCDAHWPDARQHAHGHGSLEYTATLARAHPLATVLAGHFGPALSDAEIRAAHRRHGRRAPNFQLAVEGTAWGWNGQAFAKRRTR